MRFRHANNFSTKFARMWNDLWPFYQTSWRSQKRFMSVPNNCIRTMICTHCHKLTIGVTNVFIRSSIFCCSLSILTTTPSFQTAHRTCGSLIGGLWIVCEFSCLFIKTNKFSSKFKFKFLPKNVYFLGKMYFGRILYALFKLKLTLFTTEIR